jgi:glycosyltransferase involved in cell wall biosynthesis
MRVAFGTTVWRKGLVNRHLDGIGQYSKELYHSLNHFENIDVIESYFGPLAFPSDNKRKSICLSKYKYLAVFSALTGLPFFDQHKIDQISDIFHATDHHIPKCKNIPVIATLMDAIPLSHPHFAAQNLRGLKNWVWRKSAHWADHIITISEFSKREISKHFKINENKISVIGLGVDVGFFDRIASQEIDKVLEKNLIGKEYLLFIGTLQPRKNIERMIEAYQLLPTELRNRWQLIIVGKNGWGCDALVKALRNQPSDANIRWLDDVGEFEKKALLQGSAALVFPSLFEGFGLPVLEGFASQTPVITSNTTSLLEVASDAALTVDPYDTSALSQAMQTVMVDGDLRKALIQSGLSRARLFTWNACAKKTVDVYRQFV